MKLTYKKRFKYKYRLSADYSFKFNYFELGESSGTQMHKYLSISDGFMTIKKGYCWDGASGPTIDTKNVMKASLVHDALYQLMREGISPQSARKYIDNIFREICLEQGMSRFRAWYLYTGIRMFGARAAKPSTLIIK